MLFTNKKNFKFKAIDEKNKYKVKSSKNFPSSIREWNNSIYVYNKSALNLIPNSAINAIKIVKSYFSLFNNNIESKVITERFRLKSRRFSLNKIYLSNGEFKHTNNKVLITLYLFNRQKHKYLYVLHKILFKKKYFLNRKFSINRKKLNLFKNNFIDTIWYVEKIKPFIFLERKMKLDLAEKFKDLYLKKLIKIKNKSLKDSLFKYVSNNSEYYKVFLENFMARYALYRYYRQLIFINKSKYDYTYLQYLNNYLTKLYNKNIEFNLVNLKKFYLNSDIMSESITLKLTKNRRKMLRYLNTLKNKVKIKKKRIFLGKALSINNKLDNQKDLSNIIKKSKDFNIKGNNLLQHNIIKSLKYKDVTGFRIETKGRLTKRYTASRSVLKTKYKGNLLNLDSSYRGISSVLLKGNLKSNIQFTKLKSKSRIGSFGVKGWVGGN